MAEIVCVLDCGNLQVYRPLNLNLVVNLNSVRDRLPERV